MKKIIAVLLAVVLIGGGLGGFTYAQSSTHEPMTGQQLEEQKVKHKPIVIGAARPLSGPNSFFEESAFGPIYRMWVDEVNAQGGIYVKNKKLPIELLVYDDTSDVGKMTELLEKLMVEDKVDFVLSPATTAFLHAAAPVFNKHGYILLGAEGGSAAIREMLPGVPYYFGVLNYSDHYQMPVLADLLDECGVETAAIMFVEDLHGIEYSGAAVTELGKKGIDVVMIESVPPRATDVLPILQEAQALDVDAFLSFCFPNENLLATGQAIGLGFNPDVFLLGPGGNFEFFEDIFGADLIEGVIAEGAWNCNSSPAAQEFYDKFIAAGNDPGIVDWWGHLFYWAELQFFEQAIEMAGTLDQAVIREVMATQTFETCLGPTWFETIDGGGCLLAVDCHPGEIGQWQNGVFEVIGPEEKATAPPIYPKPAWSLFNQVWAHFNTVYHYNVPGDSFTNGNEEVTGWKSWWALLMNSEDGTGAPVTGLNLSLETELAFDYTDVMNGNLVTEGPLVYEWSFGDVAQGEPWPHVPWANVQCWGSPHPFPVTFTPGFNASRSADKTEFLQSEGTQTQTLTISLTLLEQQAAESLFIHVQVPFWIEGQEELVDAVITPPTGVEFALTPDGQRLWIWPAGLTVEDEWTTTVTIELTPNVSQVTFMPGVHIGWDEFLTYGTEAGSSLSRPAGDPADDVGTWTWNATGEGDLAWDWGESVQPGVGFVGFCEE